MKEHNNYVDCIFNNINTRGINLVIFKIFSVNFLNHFSISENKIELRHSCPTDTNVFDCVCFQENTGKKLVGKISKTPILTFFISTERASLISETLQMRFSSLL